MIYDAYYSELCDLEFGSAIWETIDGKQIKISCVVKEGEESGFHWADTKFVGKVVRCVKGNGRVLEVERELEADPNGFILRRLEKLRRQNEVNKFGWN